MFEFQTFAFINRHFAVSQIVPPLKNKHYLALSLNSNLESKSQQLSLFTNNLHFWANGRLSLLYLFNLGNASFEDSFGSIYVYCRYQMN